MSVIDWVGMTLFMVLPGLALIGLAVWFLLDVWSPAWFLRMKASRDRRIRAYEQSLRDLDC